MKFEQTKNKLQNQFTYQAQFQDLNAMKRATEWLASRPSKDWKAQQVSVFTNDLQVIFELRVHFGHTIKIIRAALPA